MKNVVDIYALAPLQQLMLAHALADRQSTALVEQFRCTLRGRLDIAALRAAWEAAVARHPLLRTCFAWEGMKKPVQIVRQRVELPWCELDWRAIAPLDQSQRTVALLEDDRQQGFDITRPPLVRVQLIRTAEECWLLVWTCHHLVLDGWSAALVLREVFEHYDRALRGAAPAEQPAGQFRDYLAWLFEQDAAAADAYWRRELADHRIPTRLSIELPTGDQRQRERGHDECVLTISRDETAALTKLAAAQRVSVNTLVQAAWSVLLTRYCETEDVVLGVVVSGRPPHLRGVEATVGPFMNNVPLRVRVAADDLLMDVLARLQHKQAELQAFEHCPLEQIVRAAGLPDGCRLFDTLLVFENYPIDNADGARIGGLTIHDVHGTATSSYPLSLIAIPGDSLRLRLLFDRRRFEQKPIERVLRQVAALLRSMTERPDARVGDLSLLDAEAVGELRSRLADCGSERVLDASGRPAPIGMPGELWTSVARWSDEAADRIAVDGRYRVDPFEPSGGPLLRPTGHRGLLAEEGAIECLGPIGSPARIGNYGVDPDEVAAVVLLHSLVEEAAVVAFADRLGEVRLAAFVVPVRSSITAIESGQQSLVLEQVRRFVEERLPAPMVPRVWRAVESLPRDSAGHVDAVRLPAVARPRGEAPNPYVAPRDDVEVRLAAIWSDLLGVEGVGVTDSFLELGGYSSLAVALLARLEEEFGRRLPLAAMFQEPTIAHLAQLLVRRAGAPQEVSLVPIRPRGTVPPLFCVHPAGGTVFCYLELARHLAADIPIYGLQAQGIDDAAPPHETVEQMAEHYVTAIKSVQSAGPYRVCGWSTGGVIAFEIARQLEARGDEVGLVALCDAAIPKPGEPFGEGDIVPLLAMLFPGEDAQAWQALRETSVERQIEEFRQRAELAQLLMGGTTSAQAQRIYDVFQANMKAVAQYQPGSYHGRLTLLRAAQQATPMHADPHLGWGPWALGGIETYDTPGGHLSMFQEPAVKRVAEILGDCLMAAALKSSLAHFRAGTFANSVAD